MVKGIRTDMLPMAVETSSKIQPVMLKKKKKITAAHFPTEPCYPSSNFSLVINQQLRPLGVMTQRCQKLGGGVYVCICVLL